MSCPPKISQHQRICSSGGDSFNAIAFYLDIAGKVLICSTMTYFEELLTDSIDMLAKEGF